MAADEYDSYIAGVYELLKAKASDITISDHLRAIEITRMGYAEYQVPGHLDVAKLLREIPLG